MTNDERKHLLIEMMKEDEKSGMYEKVTDLYGYEIYGYAEAKSKKAKIEALRKHIKWLEGHHTECIRALDKMINELE